MRSTKPGKDSCPTWTGGRDQASLTVAGRPSETAQKIEAWGWHLSAKQNPKRRHHHVWQHYLKPWTTGGAIWCLQAGRIYQTGTTAVAVERDFYKIANLTVADVDYIKLLFGHGHPVSVRTHANFLNAVMAPFALLKLAKTPEQRAVIAEKLDDYATEALEDFHAIIEASFIPLLANALSGDISFYGDERCIPFLNFLCTQHMRTKGPKERAIELNIAQSLPDLRRIWNLISIMAATNLGGSLYEERSRRQLSLIANCTEMEFVTSDQPTINLKADGTEAPDRISFYYPLSPRLALILSDSDEMPMFTSDGLTGDQVLHLNRRMVEASYMQVFGHSQEALRSLDPVRRTC